MSPTIALDLDGCICDLYGVRGWLEALQAHDASPYFAAGELADTDIINALIELYKVNSLTETVSGVWAGKLDTPKVSTDF